MPKTLSKTIHITIGLDGLIDLLLKQRAEGKTTTDLFKSNSTHEPININECLRACFDYKTKGYEVWPICNNIDNKGGCLGHSD